MSDIQSPTGLESLRLVRPPKDAVVAPIDVHHLRAMRGSGILNICGEDEDAGGLHFPDGDDGVAERFLARGESARVRDFVATWDDDKKRPILLRAFVMDGQIDSARELNKDISTLCPLAAAALALAESKIDEANKLAQSALEKNPKGIAEHYISALVGIALGRVESAVADLGRVCASEPEHAVARHQLGLLTLAAGDAARAGTLFEMAIDIAPQFLPPSISLSELLIESRQFGDAMNILGAAIEENPNALPPHLLRLRILLEVGQVDSALNIAASLKEAAGNNAEVITLWAQAMLLGGRAAEAAEEVERVADQANGENKAKLLGVMSRIVLSAEPPDVQRGIAFLEKAVLATSNPAELHLELAQVHLSIGESDPARKHLQRLASLPSIDINTLLSGAITSRNHSFIDVAKELAKEALERVRGTANEGQISMFLASLG